MKAAIPSSSLLIPLSSFSSYNQPPSFSVLLAHFSTSTVSRSCSVFPQCTWPCSFALSLCPPSHSLSFFRIFLQPPSLVFSCPVLFFPLFALSLSPLGSVPAPLPWHWASFSLPLHLLLPSLLSSIPLASDWWPLYSRRRGRETEKEGEREERGAAKHTWA